MRFLVLALCTLVGCGSASTAAGTYDLHFSAEIGAETAVAEARIRVTQSSPQLRELDFNAPPETYELIEASGDAEHEDGRLRWEVPEDGGVLRYRVRIDSHRGDRFDAKHTPTWVLMRMGDLFPPARVRSIKGSRSISTISLTSPDDWSFESRYGSLKDKTKEVGGERNFNRPTGWLLGGELGTRRETINGRELVVSAPVNSGMRRLDTAAFVRWTLPELSRVFPRMPKHILIVGAPPGMWRGGLSAPGSLYLHVDRPLISENATSTLIHELIHLAGVHSAADDADWIVEGLAEYYSLLILKRTGGISESRFQQSLGQLAEWVADQDGKLASPSKGADTAAAVLLLHELALELKAAGQHIDTLTGELVERGFEVDNLKTVSEELLGRPSRTLKDV